MKSPILIPALLVLALGSCKIGKSGASLTVARQPGGAPVKIVNQGRHFAGEIVAVRDDGVIVLANKRLLFFPFGAVGTFVPAELPGSYRLLAGEMPTGEKISRLRLVSQFPQGLTADVQARLLSLVGQAAIDTIR